MPGIHERTVVIEARDLDTDERTVATFEVEMPPGEAAQKAQLAGLVARLHPEARMRSFGGGAASLLDSQHLVVAHYRGAGEQAPADPANAPPEPVEQQPLFAA